MHQHEPSERLIRVDDVKRLTGISRTQIWRLEKAGRFPRRRRLGPNSVAWVMSEVQAFVRSRAVVYVGQNQNEVTDTGSVSE